MMLAKMQRDNGAWKRRCDEIDLAVARSIRSLRIAKGISQNNLAILSGVTFQQIQKYEGGKNRIGIGRFVKIAAALEISAPELLARSLEQ